MIARMAAMGWRPIRFEAALPSVRRLGFSKVVTFSRPSPDAGERDDEIAVFE